MIFQKERFSKILHNDNETITKGYSIEHKVANTVMLLFSTFGSIIMFTEFIESPFPFFIIWSLLYIIASLYLIPVIFHKDIIISNEENYEEIHKNLSEIIENSKL